MQMSVSAKKDFFYSSLTSQAKEVKKYSVVVSSVATQKLKTFLCAALFFLLPCWADTSTALSIVTGCPPVESNEKKKQKTYSLHVDMRHADVQLTKPKKENNNNKKTENS